MTGRTEKATFASGCFWEPDDSYSKLRGVLKTTAGYTGGESEDPSYFRLGDHTEAVEIEYDPDEITYGELLRHFWSLHDPTQRRSTQYKSAIYAHGEEQLKEASESLAETERKTGRPVLTEIRPAGKFHEAEGYHQKFLRKTGMRRC
jgi:peptide-methionine (S)-S-oxide reductase